MDLLDNRSTTRINHSAGSAWQAVMAAAAPCPLLGDGITDDTLLHIASFLPTARDLLSLQLACPRFATKVIAAAPSGAAAGGAAAAAPEMLSLVEEAGRLWVAGCSEQERGWVPRLLVLRARWV